MNIRTLLYPELMRVDDCISHWKITIINANSNTHDIQINAHGSLVYKGRHVDFKIVFLLSSCGEVSFYKVVVDQAINNHNTRSRIAQMIIERMNHGNTNK